MARKMKLTNLLKATFKKWNEHEPFNNSIVISYYTLFSLPGLLVIIINLAGYFFGDEAVSNQISTQIGSAVGSDTAKSVQEMIAKASVQKGAILSTIISALTLLLGATGAFYQLRQIFNKMWEVKPKPGKKLKTMLVDRAFSVGLILVVGFLLLVSLVLSAAVNSVSKWVSTNISEGLIFLFSVLDIVLSIGLITVLFGAMFKFLPDIRIRWRDVWPGAALTAVLFVIAKFLLGIYFAKTDPGSTYGAAGSVILIMLWVTYSGLILLFGAEFTRVYADSKGVVVLPKQGAIAAKEKFSSTRHERSPGNKPRKDFQDRSRVGESKPDDKNEDRKSPGEAPDVFHYEPPA
jgi:membrane protein